MKGEISERCPLLCVWLFKKALTLNPTTKLDTMGCEISACVLLFTPLKSAILNVKAKHRKGTEGL